MSATFYVTCCTDRTATRNFMRKRVGPMVCNYVTGYTTPSNGFRCG